MNINLNFYKILIKIFSILVVINIFLYKFLDIDIFIGGIIIQLAILLYFAFSKEDIFNPISLFSLFWLGGVGLSNFKLSYDQHTWSLYVWINIILAYIMFVIGYYYTIKFNKISIKNKEVKYKYSNDRMYIAIVILFIICVLAFILEAIILGFIPLFSKSMDAYIKFKISGIHYFTVTIALIPALTIVYKSNGGKKKVILFNIFAILIPLLIVSRQLLLLELIISVITYHYSYKKIPRKIIVLLGVISIILFSAASNLRHQDLSYIYSVANMKIKKRTILVQPYLYISMNFENLRNIIENFHSYKYGINMIFPILAFTNTKNYFDFSYKQQYLTNPLFNTSTFLSDIYFDFGIIGVIIVTLLLGSLYGYIYKIINISQNKVILLIYSLLGYCLMFSFFVPWYFNPTIWFYIIIILIIIIFCNINNENKINKMVNKILKI